jgi:hypothetical protein
MKKLSRIIFIFSFLCIVALIVLLFFHFKIIEYLYSSGPELIVIEDECSIMLNNIIHQIKDEGGCRIMCSAECEIRNMKFHHSEFIFKDNSCHTCNCYCN